MARHQKKVSGSRKAVARPLLLYSASTRLAYSVAQKYYNGVHYVWCAPRPNPDRFELQNPPSSDPISIYWKYEMDIRSSDGHSSLISANRLGIARGAFVRQKQGIIDKFTRQLIEAIVEKAPITDFKPLLFIIPFSSIDGIVKQAVP